MCPDVFVGANVGGQNLIWNNVLDSNLLDSILQRYVTDI